MVIMDMENGDQVSKWGYLCPQKNLCLVQKLNKNVFNFLKSFYEIKKNTRFNGQKKSYLIGQKNPRFNYRVVLVYRVFRF